MTLATNTFLSSFSSSEKENLGTLLQVPFREQQFSGANWISIFNQLARKATMQLCAYAQSHRSMLCLASSFTVETQSCLSAPLTENRTENQNLGTHTQIKWFGPASVVITDGSNLFPLRGFEHQMVNVAGMALHHLGSSIERTIC